MGIRTRELMIMIMEMIITMMMVILIIIIIIINNLTHPLYQGYTNSDNPFGDEYLLETCVWQKKLEKEGNDKLMGEEIKKMQKIKMIENKVDLCIIRLIGECVIVG